MAAARPTDPRERRFDIEELEDLYEYAPCGYLSLEPSGRIERVNATFLTWTGHALDELLGRRFQDLLNIAGKIYYDTHFAPLLRLQGFFNEVALDLTARDGTRIPVLVNAVERRNSDGKATFIRITVFNATDRRRYEKELIAARNALAAANQELRDLNDVLGATNQRLDRVNRELHAFYDSLPVGIFRTDEHGRIVQASRRFCTLLCIERAEDWLAAVRSEDRASTVEQWQGSIGRGEPFSNRFLVADGDGVVRHIEMRTVPIPGSGNDAPAFVGVVVDATEQLRVEAQKLQIDRDAAVRQLTGGLAHNLNSILTVIVGTLDILGEYLTDRPDLHPIVDDGVVATQRAATLVSRLLLYSGYTFSRPSRLEIDPCLHDIAKGLANGLGERHPLTCDLCASGTFVQLDGAMLEEAVGELVANAVAALPEGGEIRLSTRAERRNDSDGPPDIVVAVSDQGIGMDQATVARAREPFFTRQEVGAGIGLGLSLVDGVARIAGGQLRLHSETGKGTTVEMHLPQPPLAPSPPEP